MSDSSVGASRAISVEQVNPDNEPLLRAHWEIGRLAEAERPLDFYPPYDLFRSVYATSSEDREVLLLGAFETVDGVDRLVGAGRVELFLLDNTHLATVDVFVAPAERGRGIGTALITEAERVATSHGRTTMLSGASVPADGESAGLRFAARHGYDVVHSEELKLADLAETEHTWPGLEAHAAERLAPYDLVWWVEPSPEEYLDDLCRMFGAFLGEAPLGGLDLVPQTYTPERIRDAERRRAETGRKRLVVAGRGPDGSLGGYTALTISDPTPHLAFITSTLVMPEHRGHRLGLAMKVLLHQKLRELFPECATIVTGNAGVNQWMNAVNDQLGYQVFELVAEVQKRLTPA